MSTKSTIFYGNDFHLYSEIGDDYGVYLQIDMNKLKEFEIANDQLTIGIPAEIWKLISEYKGEDLDWANKDEQEIVKYVTESVDGRIKEFNENKNSLSRLSGYLVYGDVEDKRQDQIKNGLKFFMNKKEEELKILKKYESYKE